MTYKNNHCNSLENIQIALNNNNKKNVLRVRRSFIEEINCYLRATHIMYIFYIHIYRENKIVSSCIQSNIIFLNAFVYTNDMEGD